MEEGCIFHPVSHRIKNSARRDELVGCAVEASTAYDNIIGAIKAAEEAASQAGKAADSALSVSISKWPNHGKVVTTGVLFSFTIEEAPKSNTRVSWPALFFHDLLHELLFRTLIN